MSQQDAQPTPDQMRAAGDVSQAVAQAASAAPTAEQARTDAAAAARQAADKAKLEISDEQIAAIANGVVNAMEQRGAFDAPLEPVAPPPVPAAPAGEDTGGPPPAAPAPVEAPRKRTFAQRFLGE
jgi:hypothetical protein